MTNHHHHHHLTDLIDQVSKFEQKKKFRSTEKNIFFHKIWISLQDSKKERKIQWQSNINQSINQSLWFSPKSLLTCTHTHTHTTHRQTNKKYFGRHRQSLNLSPKWKKIIQWQTFNVFIGWFFFLCFFSIEKLEKFFLYLLCLPLSSSFYIMYIGRHQHPDIQCASMDSIFFWCKKNVKPDKKKFSRPMCVCMCVCVDHFHHHHSMMMTPSIFFFLLHQWDVIKLKIFFFVNFSLSLSLFSHTHTHTENGCFFLWWKKITDFFSPNIHHSPPLFFPFFSSSKFVMAKKMKFKQQQQQQKKYWKKPPTTIIESSSLWSYLVYLFLWKKIKFFFCRAAAIYNTHTHT